MKVRITPDISFSRLRNSVGKEFEVEKLSDGGCRVEYEPGRKVVLFIGEFEEITESEIKDVTQTGTAGKDNPQQ